MNIDRLIPRLHHESVESRRRARLLLYAILIANLTALMSAAMMLYLGHPDTALALLVTLLLHTIVYVILRVTKSTAIAGHAFMWLVLFEICYDFGPDGGYSVLATIALPLAAAALLGTRSGLLWTAIGVLWAAYLGPLVFRADDFTVALGLSSAIMTIVIGIGATIFEQLRARAVEEALTHQQNLQQDRHRIREFAESTFPGIAITSERGIDYASEGVSELLGYTPTAFSSRRLVDYIHPDDLPLLSRRVKTVAARGFHAEGRLRHQDGRWVWLEVYGIPQGGKDTGNRWIFAARNIQDERLGRERLLQAQRLEGIGVLAAGLAHDFNNLLTVIIGHADLIPAGEDRESILMAATRAAELTSALMAFGRKAPTHTETIDVVAVLRQLEPMFRSLLGPRVKFTVNLPQESSSTALAAGQLDQVLLNLVTNAKEAMRNGGELDLTVERVAVSAELAETLDVTAGGYVRVTMTDTGSGMSDETLQHAFDPFYSTKPQPAGSGLGLASAYGILRQAGGAIELESSAGRGTRVRVYLCEAQAPGIDPAVETAPARADFTGLRALLVDDEPSVRALLSRTLTDGGFQVEVAVGGNEALTLAERSAPDLVVTDIVMPGMRGNELAHRLRDHLPDLPILYVSGYADPEIDEPLITQDDNARFLAKPFRPAELLNQVSALLGNKAAT